ncbi:MAG TPA: hypothetical protein VLF91_04840 [Candidatus Saccharimonadales bacterium]|nr:hypothetical protein [Candidatus Saccharimonadales bacterium]
MELLAPRLTPSKLVIALSVLVLLCQLMWGPAPLVRAAELSPRSIVISSSQAGATNVSYVAKLGVITSGTLGSIEIQFCSNSPLIGDSCTPPTGFDASSAALTFQAGETGFSIFSGSTANDIILTRPPANANPGLAQYVFSGIVNPSTNAPLFARFLTYASSDASGPSTDSGGMALAFNGQITINTEVPPYLIFCLGENITAFDCTTATEPFSDFGNFTAQTARAAQHQMVAATNAGNGYSIWAAGTTMTSGNNTIAAMNALGPSVPGTPQFGLNLRANTTPAVGQDPQGLGVGTPQPNFDQPNRFFFHSGDSLATAGSPDNFRKYTVSYIVNIPANQPGGVYSTTLTYTCLANF